MKYFLLKCVWECTESNYFHWLCVLGCRNENFACENCMLSLRSRPRFGDHATQFALSLCPCKTAPELTLRLPRCFEESGYRRFPSRRGSPSTAILTTPSGGCVQTRPPASSRIEASFSYSTAVTIMSSSPARSACAIFAPASAYGVMRLHRYCKRHHPAAEPTPAAFPDGGRSIL